jgi:hypothetical protein
MIGTKMTTNSAQKKTNVETPLTRCADRATPEQLQDILKKTAELGSIGSEDPIWDALGILTMANQSAEFIQAAVHYLPDELSKIWDIETVNRQKQQAELLTAIQKVKVQVKAPSANKKPELLAWGLGGIAIGSILSALAVGIFVVPAQINAARGKDAAAIDWLQTDEGYLVKKIVDKKRTSLNDCIDAAKKAGIKNKKGDAPCLLNLR